MAGMRPKTDNHKAVIEAVLAAFDGGTRNGNLVTIAVDKIDEVCAGNGPSTEMIYLGLSSAAFGDDRDALERALLGFNTI